MDITFGMKHGLFRMDQIVPPDGLLPSDRSFLDYVAEKATNLMSSFDGGQMIFLFLIDNKTLLWNSHLGGYRGILQNLQPTPGRFCHNFQVCN